MEIWDIMTWIICSPFILLGFGYIFVFVILFYVFIKYMHGLGQRFYELQANEPDSTNLLDIITLYVLNLVFSLTNVFYYTFEFIIGIFKKLYTSLNDYLQNLLGNVGKGILIFVYVVVYVGLGVGFIFSAFFILGEILH